MIRLQLAGLPAFLAVSGIALADDRPPYQGDPNWSMRALLGYTKTGGNTDNTSANAVFHVAHVIGDWKLLFGTEDLYGATKGETTAQAVAVHPISAVQFEWSLAWRDPEDDIVPAARRLGVGIVPYSPLGRGLLTATLTRADVDASDFRRSDPRFTGADLDHNLARAAELRRVADGLGLTPGQLALAWLLAQGPDVVPIPGSRHLDRIEQNAAAAGVRLSEAGLRGIEAAVPRAAWAGDRRSFAAPATVRR